MKRIAEESDYGCAGAGMGQVNKVALNVMTENGTKRSDFIRCGVDAGSPVLHQAGSPERGRRRGINVSGEGSVSSPSFKFKGREGNRKPLNSNREVCEV